MKSHFLYRFYRLALTVLFLGVFAQLAVAQVSIAPTSVFLNEQAPFANLLVSNGSTTPQEISISFRFGYSDNDEEGNVVINYDTTTHPASLTENVNAFPRNFVVQPGQRQTVRVTATGLGNREDGTYWTRVSILASPLSPPVEAANQNTVSAQININFEQIIPLYYQKGSVNTGLEIEDAYFVSEGNQGHFLFDLHRTGNSPFLGNVNLRVVDGSGNTRIEQAANITAYFDITRGVTFDISDLEPGNYTAEYTFQSQRRDISSNNMIPIQPIQQSQSFTIE